jgi:hypothetical protein
MQRMKRSVAGALALALSGCATATPPASLGGRTVEVRPPAHQEKPRVEGELLAVGPKRLWLRGRDGVYDVPLADVGEVRLQRHGLTGGKAVLWAVIGALSTGIALTAACGSANGENCGGVLAVTLGAWAVIGGPAAAALGRSSQLRVKPRELESLRPYARFPQGLPEGVDPHQLGAGAPERVTPP